MKDCFQFYVCVFIFFLDICIKQIIHVKDTFVSDKKSMEFEHKEFNKYVLIALLVNLTLYTILNVFKKISCIVGVFGLIISLLGITTYITYDLFLIRTGLNKKIPMQWFYRSFVCYSLVLINLYLSYGGCSTRAMKSCLLIYVTFFSLFSFLCYFMVQTCEKIQKRTNKTTYHYAHISLTITTIINVLLLGVIILMNNVPEFKYFFHILGIIGMVCSLCTIVVTIYHAYEVYMLRKNMSTNTLLDKIFMDLKCFVLGFLTFSNSYYLFVTGLNGS